jgi:hypothetical protein
MVLLSLAGLREEEGEHEASTPERLIDPVHRFSHGVLQSR